MGLGGPSPGYVSVCSLPLESEEFKPIDNLDAAYETPLTIEEILMKEITYHKVRHHIQSPSRNIDSITLPTGSFDR